ncbi:MAG: mechanosensitive ion channel [Pigmentiphaga sp.]|nr:mechanosensitive ion channel [Pigmentiphaga sp.]
MLLAGVVGGLLSPRAAATEPDGAASAHTPAALAELLENPEARQALIDQLRAHAPGEPAGQPGQPVSDSEAEASPTSRMTARVQGFLSGLAQDLVQASADVRSMARGEATGIGVDRAASMLLYLAAVMAATVAVYVLLRLAASRAYARIDRWVAANHAAAQAGAPLSMYILYRRAGAILGALVIDIGIVLLAALVGYGVAAAAGPGPGQIAPAGAIFLRAFLAVEITKVLVRTVFSTRYPYLRLLPMSDQQAHYWNGWLVRIVAVAGYSTMLVAPVASAALSPAIGRLLGLVIMVAVYGYAVRVIWRNRNSLRERLDRHAAQSPLGSRLRFVSRIWHILGIGYFTVLLVASQVDPANALPFMVKATLQTVLAIGVGALLGLVINTLLSRPLRVSDELRRRLPLLEARLNSYVPAVLKVVGWTLRIAVVLVVLDAWRAFNLSAWIASDAGAAAIGLAVNLVIVLLFAALAWTIVASIIEHRLSIREGAAMPTAREKTLLSLLRNAALIVIVTMTIMVVLSQIGIDVAPLIAGAGVVGLAIGFGAQKLVQDIITGVFIQLENGMNENDVVEVAGVFGTVEKITIRSVGIRTLDGGYHLVPFSSVDVVANHSKDFSYHLGEYTIAHRENVDEAMQQLRNAFAELMTDEAVAPDILGDIAIPGVTSLSEKGVTIRVLIKTRPGMQWAVQRAYNRLVKQHFDAAGIELPYPHTVLYFGRDKNGAAPPANITLHRPLASAEG